MNKEALQAEVGLPVDRKIPLVAFIGRLEEQKGPDVMAAAIPQLMEEDVQIVLLVRHPATTCLVLRASAGEMWLTSWCDEHDRCDACRARARRSSSAC